MAGTADKQTFNNSVSTAEIADKQSSVKSNNDDIDLKTIGVMSSDLFL